VRGEVGKAFADGDDTNGSAELWIHDAANRTLGQHTNVEEAVSEAKGDNRAVTFSGYLLTPTRARSACSLIAFIAGICIAVAVLLAGPASAHGTCADHQYQTTDGSHDADNDGIGCESLPAGPSSSPAPAPAPPPAPTTTAPTTTTTAAPTTTTAAPTTTTSQATTTSTTTKRTTTTDDVELEAEPVKDEDEEGGLVGGLLTLAILGGAGYGGYRLVQKRRASGRAPSGE
jgi:hypothetical protein